MNDIQLQLRQTGIELRSAAEADLYRRRRSFSRRRPVILLAAGLAVMVAVGAGLAAGVLKTAGQEEAGLINGAATFAGTHPVCTQLSAGRFQCLLASTPTELIFPPGVSYRGITMESVDATKHVDGGCVATSDDGRRWDCYLGEEAVQRGIIGPDYLGKAVPVPPAT